MKYFIVTDVHSYYDEMRRALDAAGFDIHNPEHIFVSLGDALDRGSQPREVLQFMLSVPQERRILIRGNHEDLLEDALTRQVFYTHDGTNGTRGTAYDLTGAKNDFDAIWLTRRDPLYNEYIANCVDYHETAGAVFVHGWIPHYSYIKGFNCDYYRHDYVPEWRQANRDEWRKARWYNGMESWADGVIEPNKTIFCGHWDVSWAREHIDHVCNHGSTDPADFAPWVRPGIVALDACTAWSRLVNCYVWEDEPLPGENN